MGCLLDILPAVNDTALAVLADCPLSLTGLKSGVSRGKAHEIDATT